MAKIKYIVRNDSKTSSIYIRFKDGRKFDLTAKTNFIVDAKDWSSKKGQPINLNDTSLKRLNEKLVEKGSQLLKHYNNSVDKEPISIQWLKDFINPPDTLQPENQAPDKIVAYIDYYIKLKRNDVGSSTYKRNNVYKNLIKRFEDSQNRILFIKDFDENFKMKFEEYCFQQNYAHNTIARTIKFIKTICYNARKNGKETSKYLDDISVTLKPIDKVYLTIDELELIEKKNFEADYLDNARDWLLISCETGQRVSDFLRFDKRMIRTKKNKKGELKTLIEFTQVKTNKEMTIPLSKKVLQILKKRGGDFPRQISDQRYNEFIKKVCELAGVLTKTKGSKLDIESKRKIQGVFSKFELVSSHIGRRSFASNYYSKMPTSVLKYITGHSTEKMFLHYIGKSGHDEGMQAAEFF